MVDGIIVPNHANVLLNHASETNNATKIFSLRRDVDRLNREEISKLPSIPHIYHCEDYFDWKPHHQGDPSLKKYTLPGAFGKRSLQQLV
jgi:ATP-dependent DNA helicase PIF1